MQHRSAFSIIMLIYARQEVTPISSTLGFHPMCGKGLNIQPQMVAADSKWWPRGHPEAHPEGSPKPFGRLKSQEPLAEAPAPCVTIWRELFKITDSTEL